MIIQVQDCWLVYILKLIFEASLIVSLLLLIFYKLLVSSHDLFKNTFLFLCEQFLVQIAAYKKELNKWAFKC